MAWSLSCNTSSSHGNKTLVTKVHVHVLGNSKEWNCQMEHRGLWALHRAPCSPSYSQWNYKAENHSTESMWTVSPTQSTLFTILQPMALQSIELFYREHVEWHNNQPACKEPGCPGEPHKLLQTAARKDKEPLIFLNLNPPNSSLAVSGTRDYWKSWHTNTILSTIPTLILNIFILLYSVVPLQNPRNRIIS